MLRCWDVEPAQRPLFCEMSSNVALIIAKMKAAAAAAAEQQTSETDSALRPAGYVNTTTVSPVADYLRPFTDRTVAQSDDDNREKRLDLSNSAAPAADGDVNNGADFSHEVSPFDGQENGVL